MTSVKLSFRKETNTGTRAPVTGVVRFRPVRRFYDSGVVVLPEPFEVTVPASGDVTVRLTPTTSRFVWQVVEFPADTTNGTDMSYTRYVTVPDTTNAVNYTDLPDVDPSTFAPVIRTDGQIMVVRFAADAASAAALSAQYPEDFVFFDEDASTASVSEMIASMADGVDAANTLASLREQAETDASTVSEAAGKANEAASLLDATTADITGRAQDVARQAQTAAAAFDEKTGLVETAAADAATRISTAVETVERMADEATGSDQPVTIPETTTADGETGEE